MEVLLRRLNKTILFLFVFVFLVILLLFFIRKVEEKENFLDNLHNRYKNFLLLLVEAPKISQPLTVEKINQIARSVGLKIDRIESLGTEFKITIKEAPAGKMVLFLSKLEKYGVIKSFSAEDNTGKGIFYLTVTVGSLL